MIVTLVEVAYNILPHITLQTPCPSKIHCPFIIFAGSCYAVGMSAPSPAASSSASLLSTTAPDYRLVYFNSQGKAEVIRYLFALARQPFVDERITKSTGATSQLTFDSVKDSLPFGQLPVLFISGGPSSAPTVAAAPLAQSRAIERFLARRFGLMGGSDVEEQQVDSVVEAVRDLTTSFAASRVDAASQQRFLDHTLPRFLQQLERLAERCSSSSTRDTLVGDKLTLADVAVYQVFSVPTPEQSAMQKLITGFPIIQGAIANVANRPEIREWVAKRPA